MIGEESVCDDFKKTSARNAILLTITATTTTRLVKTQAILHVPE